MQISYPDTDLLHIIGQILRHTLCQRRYQYLIVLLYLFVDLTDQIIDLALDWPYLNLRVKKSRRTQQLFRTKQLMIRLIIARRCRNKHHLIDTLLKFFKIQRTVIQRRRQAETIFYQRPLSRLVTGIHTTHLRQRDMGLVHNDQKVILKVIDQRIRRFARLQTGKVA